MTAINNTRPEYHFLLPITPHNAEAGVRAIQLLAEHGAEWVRDVSINAATDHDPYVLAIAKFIVAENKQHGSATQLALTLDFDASCQDGGLSIYPRNKDGSEAISRFRMLLMRFFGIQNCELIPGPPQSLAG